MEVTVYVGSEVTVVAADDGPYSPDVMDDLTTRAVLAAIKVQRELVDQYEKSRRR